MKKNYFILVICVLIEYSMDAQIGGLLNKIKKTDKTENVTFSADILDKYTFHLNNLTNPDFFDTETALKREGSARRLNSDSAKQMFEYAEKNIKKYSENQTKAEYYISTYSKFNTEFENKVISKINEIIKTPYNNRFEIQEAEMNWFKNTVNAIEFAKTIYTGSSNLSELINAIKTKKNDYAAALIKTKSLACTEQLDYFRQIRFSNSFNESNCIKGADNFNADPTNTGVYIYYTGELPLSGYDIYIDGKITNASLSYADLEDSNNGSKKPDNGWYKFQLLPGLRESNSRTTGRLIYLSKNGLTKSCEIELKNDRIGSSYKFKYTLPSFVGDINSYCEEVKKNYLKTIKLTDTKYSNANVEKETIEAYKKHNTINPQFDIGEVKKVNVAGNDWNIYKTKLGLPDYQQTDAYFLVKGKDGNCYSDFRKIRRVYDPVTKNYGPIKVVGSDSKREISCELVK